jgi:hypothetical protein
MMGNILKKKREDDIGCAELGSRTDVLVISVYRTVGTIESR